MQQLGRGRRQRLRRRDGNGHAGGHRPGRPRPGHPVADPAHQPGRQHPARHGHRGPGTPAGTTPGGTPGTRGGAPNPAGAIWQPRPGVTWQWQLGGTLDQSVDVPVYDIDGFEHDASVVAALHAKGRKVVCYVNAGSWEDFRPDATAFSKSLQGSGNGWQGEKWFDIRQIDKLKPLMATRFDMCRAKGFDAVEPDLLDAYVNKTGFPLTANDQLAYNRMIAGLAHERGMAVALKNDLDQIPELVGDFDFAVNEQCAEYDECAKLSPFIKAGKAVLHVEYNVPVGKFCSQAKSLGLSSMEKHLNLDAWRQPC